MHRDHELMNGRGPSGVAAGNGEAAGLPPKLLSYAEVADIAGVTVRTVSNWTRGGQLRVVAIGHVRRVDPTDLTEFFERAKGGG